MFPHIGAATSACWRTWDICALICWDSTRAEKIHLEPEYPSRSWSLCPYSKVVQVDLKVKFNLLVIVEVEMSRGLQVMVDHVKSRYIANYVPLALALAIHTLPRSVWHLCWFGRNRYCGTEIRCLGFEIHGSTRTLISSMLALTVVSSTCLRRQYL